MNRPDVFDLINAERDRQSLLWGVSHRWGHGDCSSHDVHDTVKALVLSEECGEVVRAVLEAHDTDVLRAELVQVAAVAVAWLEAL